jgi:hypothetical protein
MKTKVILYCALSLVLATLALAWEGDNSRVPSSRLVKGMGKSIIYSNFFDYLPLGNYSADQVVAEWIGEQNRKIVLPHANGISNDEAKSRVRIIHDPKRKTGKALEVSFPQGGDGPLKGGVQWLMWLRNADNKPLNELYLTYWVMFPPGFDFRLGGKLPGLAGGKANAGGLKPNGQDGWSAKIMWRENGRIIDYVYFPDQAGQYGADFQWGAKPCYFETGRWYEVCQFVKMNSPGKKDGEIKAWLDGQLALEVKEVRFRDTEDFAIDWLYFSTFFGGQGEEWAPVKDEKIYFDGFVVSAKPLR